MARKKGADSSATMATIIAAAQRIVADEGAAGLSLRKVARVGGVSLGTVNYYFSSREQLVQACLDQQQAPLRAALDGLQQQVADGAAVEEVIGRAVGQLYLHELVDPELLRLRLMTIQEGGERTRHHPGPFLMTELELATTFLVEAGGLERQSARLVVQSIAAIVARYLTFDPSELSLLIGVDDLPEARKLVAAHLERLVVGTLRAHQP